MRYFAVIRIFTLLFIPMGIWVTYSWYDGTVFNLPKIDKVELLKFTYLPPPVPVPVQKIHVVKKIVIKREVDINKTDENRSSSERLSSHERIFILGDSMGEGIAYGMENIKKSFHLKVKSIAKRSTTTYFWLADKELESEIEAFKPTLILVVLGANEWNGASNGTKLRIMKIHNRLSHLNIKTVWVTPPVEKSTQFFIMVHEIYGNDTYDSRSIDLPRGPDKVHPTLHGYVTWSKKILLALKDAEVAVE